MPRIFVKKVYIFPAATREPTVHFQQNMFISDKPSMKDKQFDTLAFDEARPLDTDTKLFDTLSVGDVFRSTLGNMRFAEGVSLDELYRMRNRIFDTLAVDEARPLDFDAKLFDTVGFDDSIKPLDFDLKLFETIATRESRYRIDLVMPPDGDAWTEQAAATTNHGSTTILQIHTDAPAINDGEIAWLKWNFTSSRFADLASIAGALNITFSYEAKSSSAIAGATIRHNCGVQAGDPFNESTITWNTQPAIPAGNTVDDAVPAGTTYADRSVVLPLDVAEVLGSWLYIAINIPNTATATNPDIKSREFSTDITEIPRLTFSIQRSV